MFADRSLASPHRCGLGLRRSPYLSLYKPKQKASARNFLKLFCHFRSPPPPPEQKRSASIFTGNPTMIFFLPCAECSSCSPDFGVMGVSDRLGQISPKLVFFSLGYFYDGKWHDCRKLAADVLTELPGKHVLPPFITNIYRFLRLRRGCFAFFFHSRIIQSVPFNLIWGWRRFSL